VQNVKVVPSTFCAVHICSSKVELFLDNFVLHHTLDPTAMDTFSHSVVAATSRKMFIKKKY
jgi:hypothetical protein